MNLILIYFAYKYKGYFHDIYKAIKNREYVPLEEINKIKHKLETNQIKAITIVDDDYPEALKLINNPPFVLFYKGNKELLKDDLILFTGEFENKLIRNFTFESLEEISKYHTIVNNGYQGLDGTIIDALIKNNKKLIIVSPNGTKDPYINCTNIDFSTSNNVLLISEFPEESVINKKRLIERNHLSMGISQFLIIASSKKKGPITNLVSFALEQGKDIYCFPGLQMEDDGNNELINDGAKMIRTIKELRN